MQPFSRIHTPFNPSVAHTSNSRAAPLFRPARRQWLAVDGLVTDRFLVSYRVPKAQLQGLIPAPFELDTFRGCGFISVCVLEVREMGIRSFPRAFRFHNLEVLYRVGVRFAGQPTFITLRSDTSSRALAWLGGLFSHYRLQHARVRLARRAGVFHLTANTRSGEADATLVVNPNSEQRRASNSVFDSADAADQFLLGMGFSADPGRGRRVLLQPIEHSPWQARFIEPARLSFVFLERLARERSLTLEYDCTLWMRNITQTWRAATWVPR